MFNKFYKTFANGLRRVLDIGGVTTDPRVEQIRRKYKIGRKTTKDSIIADQKALESDWKAIGDDLRKVVPAEYFFNQGDKK